MPFGGMSTIRSPFLRMRPETVFPRSRSVQKGISGPRNHSGFSQPSTLSLSSLLPTTLSSRATVQLHFLVLNACTGLRLHSDSALASDASKEAVRSLDDTLPFHSALHVVDMLDVVGVDVVVDVVAVSGSSVVFVVVLIVVVAVGAHTMVAMAVEVVVLVPVRAWMPFTS